MDNQQERGVKDKIISITKIVVPIVIVLSVIIYYIGNNYIQKEGKNKKIKADVQVVKTQVLKRESIINSLVSKNKALKDWSKDIYSTIQLQEKIIGKPVLYGGEIVDIFLKEGKIFIKLSSSYLDDLSYTLELECDRKLVDKIRTRIKDDFTNGVGDDYAVIAQLNSISKASVKLIAEIDGEDKYIDFDSSGSDLYLGYGRCIDLTYIKDVDINLDLWNEK